MSWNWSERAKSVEQARRACVASWQPGHAEAAARFHQALAEAWPPGFFEQLERCKRGESTDLEAVLQFVEACPRFFRSGYILAKALRWLPRPPRSDSQSARLRKIVLDAVERRLHVPFESIPALARAVDSPELRAELVRLARAGSARVTSRAERVLDGLPGPAWDPERARLQRADQRALTLLVTVQRTKSATLVRKLLSLEPGALGANGRKCLAVGFELAMNWGLLPDEELLAIATRIDGPELEPVWRWALRRADTPGERARWMFARLKRR